MLAKKGPLEPLKRTEVIRTPETKTIVGTTTAVRRHEMHGGPTTEPLVLPRKLTGGVLNEVGVDVEEARATTVGATGGADLTTPRIRWGARRGATLLPMMNEIGGENVGGNEVELLMAN